MRQTRASSCDVAEKVAAFQESSSSAFLAGQKRAEWGLAVVVSRGQTLELVASCRSLAIDDGNSEEELEFQCCRQRHRRRRRRRRSCEQGRSARELVCKSSALAESRPPGKTAPR